MTQRLQAVGPTHRLLAAARRRGSRCHAAWASVLLLLAVGMALAQQPNPLESPVGPGQLRDITGIEDVPPEPPPPRWPWIVAGAGAALPLGFLAVRRVRRWLNRPEPPLPPDVWALRELDLLDTLQLVEEGRTERYHTQLSDIVRTYLEERFQIHAPALTTVEFLSAMRGAPDLSEPLREVLREFLERCDLGKFAPVQPSPDECRARAAMARRLVVETKPSQTADAAKDELKSEPTGAD